MWLEKHLCKESEQDTRELFLYVEKLEDFCSRIAEDERKKSETGLKLLYEASSI